MARIRISKETAVPIGGAIAADTIYVVSVGVDKVEFYMSNSAGTALRRLLNEADIQALIDASAGAASSIDIVDNIAARDALALTTNALVIVEDASGDATVTSGAALYAYKQSTDTFSKLSEFESMDVVLNWSSIQGGPSSSPAAIDSAVTNSHSHANKTQLDLIGQDGDGDPTYNGSKIANEYTNLAW